MATPEYKKYTKKETTVGAMNIVVTANYGSLGTLGTEDFMIYLTNGSVVTMSSTFLHANYSQASDTAPLTGTDYD